jgi:hypothetical protein
MATHYKGQRITELLNTIASMEMKLDAVDHVGNSAELLAEAYTTITIAKAKLTALQGEDK